MKKVLIIGYDFRASSLAGSFRLRQFAIELGMLGHTVKVVAAFSDAPSSSSDNPNVDLDVTVIPPQVDYASLGSIRRVIRRLVAWPDPSIGWARQVMSDLAFAELVQWADVVLVSTPPHGLQAISVHIKRNYKKFVLADLRDDFLSNHRIKWRTPIHKIAGKRIESDLVQMADCVVLNTDEVRNRFVKRYSIHASKLRVVPNGYKKNYRFGGRLDFTDLEAASRSLVYVGSPYDGFAKNFIAQLANAVTGIESLSALQVLTAGPGAWEPFPKFARWRHLGLVPETDAAYLMREARLLLLIMPPGEEEPSGTVPLKAYSYLASGRRIVYFGEKGSTTELLSRFTGTVCFRRGDIDAFVAWATANMDWAIQEDFDREPDLLHYEFSKLTTKLASLFEQPRVSNE